MLLFVARIYERFSVKTILALSVIVYGGSYALRGAMNSITGFCIIYAVGGAASAFILYVPIPMLINNWFAKKKSLALSIAMMSAGFTGMISNPILAAIINRYGWRTASAVNGIATIVIALPFVLLFAVKKPDDMGLKPYGYEENENTAFQKEADATPAEFSESRKKFMLLISFIAAGFIYFIACTPQQLSNYAVSTGFDVTMGATLASLAMAGNIGSKAVIGLVIDRIGPKKTFLTDMVLLMLGFALLLISPRNRLLIYLAAFIMGFSCANNVLLPPQAVAVFSSGEEYTKNLALANTGTMLVSAFSLFIGSWLYDIAGSYSIYMIVCLALQAVCMVITAYIFSRKRTE